MTLQQPDPRPGFYYVSVLRDSRDAQPDYRLLLGPFVNDHAGALAAVEGARLRAMQFDARAQWYAYGTCRCASNQGPGILNTLSTEIAQA